MNCDELYYDGQCPLCVAEMDRLREHADDELELIDIHSVAQTEALPHREQLLGTLHLKTADGGFLVGVDANVAAWSHTRFGWLWRPLRWPLVRVVADALYRHWARWRYRRLYGENPPGV